MSDNEDQKVEKKNNQQADRLKAEKQFELSEAQKAEKEILEELKRQQKKNPKFEQKPIEKNIPNVNPDLKMNNQNINTK